MTRITLSMEIELGWGVHDLGDYSRLSEGRKKETEYLNQLLEVCDRLSLPFTFDVVGHLFLRECNGCHDGPYPSGWFDADPGTNVELDPLFYAPDLIESILDSAMDHEIATHSFSHVNCKSMDNKTIIHDIKLAQNHHKKIVGTETKTFVPPRHYEPPETVIKECGLQVIRSDVNIPESKVGRFKSLLLGPHPVLEDEYQDNWMICRCTPYGSLPASFLPRGPRKTHWAFRYLPLPNSIRQRLHRRKLNLAVERAIQRNSSLHLWCHLHDISCPSQWWGIKRFLNDLAIRQSRGDIEVVPLCDFAPNTKENIYA